MTTRPLNVIERCESLLNAGSAGNSNFSVVGAYRGRLDGRIVKEGIDSLRQVHSLLRVALTIDGFVEIHAPAPLSEMAYLGGDQWRDQVKKELRKKFSNPHLPLWRVVFVRGEEEGQLMIIFHHIIADGVCAMQVMNHFFHFLSGKEVGFKETTASLDKLFKIPHAEPDPAGPIAAREPVNHYTNFLKCVIDRETTAGLLAWTKSKGIKMNATLFAALLLAAKRKIENAPDLFQAITNVNFRPYFSPPVSNEVMQLLVCGLFHNICVHEDSEFLTVAQQIHKNVHDSLSARTHITSLREMANVVHNDLSPNRVWSSSKAASNAMVISNAGDVSFRGTYANLSLTELFFVANLDLFFESPKNLCLTATTFDGRIFLTLCFIEDLKEETASTVLKELESILKGVIST